MKYSKEEVENLIKLFADECETDMNLCDYNGRDVDGNKIWKDTDLEEWLKFMLNPIIQPESIDDMTDWEETQN